MAPSESAPRHYCWFDTEFTSLDLDAARLLQVSLMVTDTALRPIVPADPAGIPAEHLERNGLNVYLRPPDGWEPEEFHRTEMAGVLERCGASRLGAEDADALLARYLDAAIGPTASDVRGRPLMAGNSVHNDWFLARRDLPAFAARLHYRLLDVSALKSEWLVLGGGSSLLDKDDREAMAAAFPPADLGLGSAHDAYYDAQASCAELAWYRARRTDAGTSA
jgi:oligoribonuclease (3'-5' exoribonuclease)